MRKKKNLTVGSEFPQAKEHNRNWIAIDFTQG